MTRDEITLYVTAAIGPIVAALVAGKFLKRLVLKPFQWWASRTENKFDDQLIHDAEDDLGLDRPAEKKEE